MVLFSRGGIYAAVSAGRSTLVPSSSDDVGTADTSVEEP
eukprot:CAMPEP_0202807690 /NCGR_PEP_ID=MMETSP1389-20130828/377_1 /ASSEMBLY_ACC=CAM_ASM_000865 /TAXON_ID=302021 /ORGANISM="Rhodomonas sp., Strain CCMP768" /LENGTH=38 /DNA_ID= /DNA_START= /DNA_END= /DNA_ORIENTATION=